MTEPHLHPGIYCGTEATCVGQSQRSNTARYDDRLARDVGRAHVDRFCTFDRVRRAHRSRGAWRQCLMLYAVHPDRRRPESGYRLAAALIPVPRRPRTAHVRRGRRPGQAAALLHQCGYRSRPVLQLLDGGPDLYPRWRLTVTGS